MSKNTRNQRNTRAKRTVDTRKTTSAKNNKSSGIFVPSVLPFLLLALAVIAETCLILGEKAGKASELISALLFGLFGVSAHFICLATLIIAFNFKELYSLGILGYKTTVTALAALCIAPAGSIIGQNGFDGAKFSFAQFWNSGRLCESGGVLGGLLGFPLAKLLTQGVAIFVLILAVIALVGLAIGQTKLGLFAIIADVIRAKKPRTGADVAVNRGENSVKAPPVRSKKALSAKKNNNEAALIPAKIDTLVESDEQERLLPPISEASSENGFYDFSGEPLEDEDEPSPTKDYFERDYFGFLDEDAEENSPKASEYDVTEGSHTIQTVDFNAPTEPTKPYSPSELMEKFGLAEQEKAKKDIYTETKKQQPEARPTIKKGASSKAYSPFASLFMSREDFLAGNVKETEKQTVKKAPGRAYSPFSDPLRSMNEPPRTHENSTPQSYIASGAEELWSDIKKQADALSGEKDSPLTDTESVNEAESSKAAVDNEILASVAEKSLGASPKVSDDENIDPFIASRTPKADLFTAKKETSYDKTERVPAFAPRESKSLSVSEVSEIITSSIEEPLGGDTATNAPITAENNRSVIDDYVDTPEQEDPAEKAVFDDTPDPRVKNPFGIYNKLRYPKYVKPSSDLLDPPDGKTGITDEEIYEIQSKLIATFESFHIDAKVTGYSVGPSITRYEITPGPGVKVKQITNLSEDIGLALQSDKLKGEVRIVTVPGKSVIGIEVPNSIVTKVPLRSLIENKDFQKAKSKITVCVGLTISGKPIYMNIDDMPHVLVAGQTKSGKSVAINCMIISLIYRASPDEVQFILIDPKRVELSIYNDIPHMVMPVIDDPKRAAAALKWAVAEMERRYQLLNDAQVRNRDEYYATRDQNPKFEYMPQIVIIIDELADLMLQVREHVEELINRIAAMARACGMHLVIGTQRPSVDVVTGLIKANIPSRISFKVSSHTDSRIILGNVGAEKLLGRGDMLYFPTGGNQIRAQGAFVDTPEIKRILNFIIEGNGKAEYDPEVMYALQNETDKLNKTDKKAAQSDDYAVDCADIDFEYLCQAAELVLNMGKATTNVIQRHLKIGFNRAANLVEKLEELGFVSAAQGSKPRDVLIDWKTYQEWRNNNAK